MSSCMSVGLVLVVVSAVLWSCPVGVNGGACNMWFMRPRGGRGDAPSHPPWHNMRPMGVRGCPLPPIGNVDAIAAREKGGGGMGSGSTSGAGPPSTRPDKKAREWNVRAVGACECVRVAHKERASGV